MKGTYCLVVRLGKPVSVRVGRLGVLHFRPGYYAYVGSALNSLEKRIQRHLSPAEAKKKHWHIDYLLEHGDVAGVRVVVSPERLECRMAERVGQLSGTPVKGFGCSDCSCKTHLYYFPKNPLSNQEFEAVWKKGFRN